MKNIKALKRIIGQLNYILSPKQKRESVVVFFCMIISSALEMLGISVVYPFLQLMMDEDALTEKWYLSWVYQIWPEISFSSVLVLFCIVIILVYLVKNVAALICDYVQIRYSAVFQCELSTLMLKSILKRPYEYFISNNTEKVLQHVHGDTHAAYMTLINLYGFLSNLFTVLLIGSFLIVTDYKTAICALVLAAFCFMLIVLVFKKRLKSAGKEMIRLVEEQAVASHEAIYGIKEISVMRRRDCFVTRYNKAAKAVQRITILNGFLEACPNRIIEGICIAGFIAIAGTRIASGENPKEFIPALGAFALAAFKILPSISNMSSRINNVVFNQTRLETCYNNLKEAKRFDVEMSHIVIESDYNDEDSSYIFNSTITVENISWRYAGAENKVLRNLSLTINKGDAIALIGESGAGKTTLADILLGLFKPQSGRILMDGIDTSTIPRAWSRMVGYVPQAVYLTDDTIRANVAFGLPQNEIDDSKIWRALEQAQLADHVRNLQRGLDSHVGERGIRFSGGQRQRIAIARALYENPEILILDEATSALDSETETAVMEAINSLMGVKTLIIIAHRLTTIRNCNKIYEIRDGNVVERSKDSIISKELMR